MTKNEIFNSINDKEISIDVLTMLMYDYFDISVLEKFHEFIEDEGY